MMNGEVNASRSRGRKIICPSDLNTLPLETWLSGTSYRDDAESIKDRLITGTAGHDYLLRVITNRVTVREGKKAT